MDSYTQGFERSYTVNSSILHGIEPRLKDFHQLLLSPPKVKHLSLSREQMAPDPISGCPCPAQPSWLFSESTTRWNRQMSFEETFTPKIRY